jgi:hypothetical protein
MAAALDRMPDTSPADAPPRSAVNAWAAVAKDPRSALKEPIRWTAPPLTQDRTWAAQLAVAAAAVAAELAAGFAGSAAEATQAMQIKAPAAATVLKTLCLATQDLPPVARRGPGPGWRSCGSGP